MVFRRAMRRKMSAEDGAFEQILRMKPAEKVAPFAALRCHVVREKRQLFGAAFAAETCVSRAGQHGFRRFRGENTAANVSIFDNFQGLLSATESTCCMQEQPVI